MTRRGLSATPLYWLLSAGLIALFLIAPEPTDADDVRTTSRFRRYLATQANTTERATPSLIPQAEAGINDHPTLADFWTGQAEFVIDIADTGLPMGESETIVMSDGTLWSYVHASDRSAGVVDRCGDPVAFPGCTVIYRSADGGASFTLDEPVCQFACMQCPCQSKVDHVNQQQYPRVAFDGKQLHLVYEYGARIMHRISVDGRTWSDSGFVPRTGIWQDWYRGCPAEARIGEHPFTMPFYDCLVGGPPGLYAENGELYVFVGLGQNPGSMGCYRGPVDGTVDGTMPLRYCERNPLFTGAADYGPHEEMGAAANAYFGFRTISSADVVKVGNRYYMFFEGVRGPGPGDPGDTQFGLGLARSQGDQIDGPWKIFNGNPILVDLPGNIGLGHADVVVLEGETYLYTSLDGLVRSRLRLQRDKSRVSKKYIMNPNPILKRLGLTDTDRAVIFHADDIGMCHASLAAYAEMVDFGLLSSAAVMVPCPWFLQTATYCSANQARYPHLDMGVHLTLTSEGAGYRWGPLSTRASESGLLDDEGYFPRTTQQVQEKATPAAVRMESQAQLDRALAAGIDVTHIDSHMGASFHPKFLTDYVQMAQQAAIPALILRSTIAQLQQRWGMTEEMAVTAARRITALEEQGFPTLDVVTALPLEPAAVPLENRLETAKATLAKLPSGVSYFIVHPSKDTPELRAITSNWPRPRCRL